MTREHSPRNDTGFSVLLAVLLACLVLLLPIAHKPLVAWDEGIYAEVSREMLHGSWLVPHWNAQLWFEKPPLILWITALFFKLFGVSEFTARAESALSGVAIVGILHHWLLNHRRRLRGGSADSNAKPDHLAAWLSTFLLLSTLGFLHICSLGETDVLLSLGCLVALLGLMRVQRGAASGWYGFWLGFAVALMTKGAASVVLPITLVLFLVTESRRQPNPLRGSGKAFFAGLACFLVLVAPWHIYMLVHFGQAFLHEYIGFHVLHRATAQIEDHRTHLWYYLGVLLASAAPWVLIYPFVLAASFRSPGMRPLRVIAVFVLVVLLFFTAVQTRLPHYIAPVYPALTLLTAVYAADKLRAWRVPQASAAKRISWVLACVAAWAMSALLTDVPRKHLHSAKLTRGAIPPDSRETAGLLKALRQQRSLPRGPLLLWSQANSVPIAPAVFYAQRPVQQVQLPPVDPTEPTDKYLHAPEQLAEALQSGPRLLLLDRTLLPELPAGYSFTPLETGKTLQAGIVSAPPPQSR